MGLNPRATANIIAGALLYCFLAVFFKPNNENLLGYIVLKNNFNYILLWSEVSKKKYHFEVICQDF